MIRKVILFLSLLVLALKVYDANKDMKMDISDEQLYEMLLMAQ